MKESRLLYTILGISEKATDEQIKESFRKKAKTHHPDRGGDASIFASILEAYRILSNPETRKSYDKTGYTGNEQHDDMEVCLEVLRTLFGTVLQSPNITEVDIPSQLITMVMKSIQGFKTSREFTEVKIKQLEKVKKRLHYKDDSIDVLQDEIAKELNKCQNNLVFLKYQIKIYGKITEIISNYTYEKEDKIPKV